MMLTMEKIYDRLISFGYPIGKSTDSVGNGIYVVKPEDEMILRFVLEKWEMQTKGECNVDTVPEELEYKIIDHIVGEFLMTKKNLGQLIITDIDFSEAVKSIQEGDTTITFEDNSSQAAMFDTLLSFLLKPIDYSDYRRIRW